MNDSKRRGAMRDRLLLDPRAVPAMLFFAGLMIAGILIDSAFTNTFNIASILTQATPLMLVAIGQAFVVGSGGLDLSVGASVSLSAVVLATTIGTLGPAAIPVAVVCALVVGVVNGIGVASGLNPFLMTLATYSVAQGVIFTIRDSPGGKVPRWFGEIAGYWGTSIPRALPLVLVVAIVAWVTLCRTRLGAHILAVGGDREVARLSGINVARAQIAAYAIAALAAGLAGLFVAARTRTGDPLIGQGFTLDSLAAVVLGGSLLGGGRVTIAGTIFGTLSLALLAKVLNFSGLASYYQEPLKGLLIVAAVLVPSLITGMRARRVAHVQATVALAGR